MNSDATGEKMGSFIDVFFRYMFMEIVSDSELSIFWKKWSIEKLLAVRFQSENNDHEYKV